MIDETKCEKYIELTKNQGKKCVKKFTLEVASELESCKFEDYISQMLEYIDGTREKFEFNKKN